MGGDEDRFQENLPTRANALDLTAFTGMAPMKANGTINQEKGD